MAAVRPSPWKIIFAFGLVYVFWGSTYLGIGIAVEQIPPAFMCSARFLIAGVVMLAYCAITGRQIRFSPTHLAHFAVVGLLLLMGGNLTLSYAEKIVPTGLSALLVAISPLWFLVIDSLLLGDHHISRRGKLGLVVGIVGVIVLIWPGLMHPTSLGRRELWWSIALQGGSLCWALGSVLSKKWQTGAIDPFSSTAWQVFFAGLGNLAFAFVVERNSEDRVDRSRRQRHSLPGGLRFVDRIHRLHLAAAARSHVEGFHLCVCKSGGRGFSGMARSA
jgi:drug/metabolite transporter (DMT)-like permease